MNTQTKKSIGVVVLAVILFAAYYGSILPFKKSRAFISAIGSANSAKSLDEMKSILAKPLDIKSPIGQEELVRNMTNAMLGLLNQQGANAELTGQLLAFIEGYYKPIVDRNRGMSFNQDLYLLGALNELAFLKTGDVKYLSAAERYFTLGVEKSPKRPQFLSGLFDVYRAQGNIDRTKRVAEQILAQWPGDERTRELFNDFLKKSLTNKK